MRAGASEQLSNLPKVTQLVDGKADGDLSNSGSVSALLTTSATSKPPELAQIASFYFSYS